jgi:hypothetical protein
MSFLRGLFVFFGGKKTPEERQRMMESLKIDRFEIFKKIHHNLPPRLRCPEGETTPLYRAIAEQINYATASSQFVGDDQEMLEKLKALVAELRANEAEKAASEIISAMKMRPHYLAMVERIMR